MPERFVYLTFFIDTNRINARESLPHMSQLEEWYKNGVIDIAMPIEAFQEATSGRNAQRNAKARSYGRPIVTARMQAKYECYRQEVENVLFPLGAQTQGEQNDVMIVLNAGYYMAILVTNDGDSKRQPNGILGNREELARLGIQVMRDSEAIELVKEKIRERDALAKAIAERTGEPLPEWVETDCKVQMQDCSLLPEYSHTQRRANTA
jgi:hypothetical protein